ncbi:MAG: DUF4142 domain-containing protein [Bacteroidia bacterium]
MKKVNLFLAIAFSMSAAYGQNTLSDKDKKFVNEAAEGGLMEVRLGELAETNGSSADVKNLGKQMISDHSKGNSELKTLAAKKNITLPSALNEKEQKAYDKLASLKGEDFDKAYTKCMVKDHKKDICEFKKQAKKGDDADVKTWAANTIPVLENHKMLSEETCKKIKHKN